MDVLEKKYSVEGLQQFPSFNQVEVNKCELNILVGNQDFQFCINEASSKEGLLVKRMALSDVNNINDLTFALESIFEDHPSFLKFWSKIKISFKSSSFTLVPEEYFHAEKKDNYLFFSNETSLDQGIALDDFNSRKGYHLIYAASKVLKHWFDAKFEGRNVEYYHQAGPMIRATLPLRELSEESSLLLFKEKDRLIAWQINKGQLNFFNQFQLEQKSDLLKYTNVIFHTLKLDKAKTQIYLYGLTDLEDEGKLLSSYFKNVNNGPIPSKLAGWQIEKTFPLGKYMDLLCLSLL